MGNTQSAEARPKPLNKLSKPKTNRSVSTLFSAAPGTSSRFTLNRELSKDKLSSFAAPVESGDEPFWPAEPPVSEKRLRRLSLFRSKSSPVKPLPVRSAPPTPVYAADHQDISDPLARYSRYGTTVNSNFHASSIDNHPVTRLQRSSTQLQLNSHQQPRLSSLSERPYQSVLRTELSRQHGYLIDNGGRNKRYSTQSSIHSTEYAYSDAAAVYPLRRRSLLMPGVATRASSISDTPPPSSRRSHHEVDFSRGNSLLYIPRKEELQRPVRASTMPAESEMFQIWAQSDQLKEFAPPRRPAHMLENERSATPGDSDYGHLSSKLGLLRITNGAVSPGPNLPEKNRADAPSARTTDQEDGYMTAPEGHQSDGEALFQRRHDAVMRAVAPNKRSRLSLPYKKNKPPRSSGPEGARESKPVTKAKFHIGPETKRKEPKPDPLVRDPPGGTEFVGLHNDTPPQTHETQVKEPLLSLGQFDFENSFDGPLTVTELTLPPLPVNTKPQSPRTPIEIARAYMQEITSSPSSFDARTPTSPQFQATSKLSAFEDHLFDDEPDSTVSLVNSFSTELDSHLSLKSGDEKVEELNSTKADDGLTQAPHKPLAKADSGYSSTGSLLSERSRKSLRDVRSRPEPLPPPVPEKNGPPTPPKEFMPSSPVEDHRQELPSQRKRVSKIRPCSIQRPPIPNGSPKSKELQSATSKALPMVPLERASTLSSRTDVRRPPMPHMSTEPSLAVAKMRSLVVTGRAVRRRYSLPYGPKVSGSRHRASKSDTAMATVKLQTEYQLSNPPIVQSSYEIPAASVPPVPHDVSAALAERVKKFPDLTYYHKLEHAASKETLNTIFSVGSAEQAESTSIFSRFDRSASEGRPNGDLQAIVTGKAVPVPKGDTQNLKTNVTHKALPVPKDDLQSPYKSVDDPVPRRSTPQKSPTQKEFEHRISSFGTLSEPLGSSPNEVALGVMITSQKRFSQSQNLTAAHDAGDRIVAKGRMVGVSSPTSPRFARDRSYRGATNGTDDQLGYSRRVTPTGSVFDEIPPVPALPVKEETLRPRSPSKKTKSQPPVTMATQRKSSFVAMTSPNTPAALVSKEPVSPLPSQVSSVESPALAQLQGSKTQSQAPPEDIWARQRELWRMRKTSAENLSAKSSTEALRSAAGTGQPSHEDISNESQQRVEIDRRFSPGPLNQNPTVGRAPARRPPPPPIQTGKVRNQETARQSVQSPHRQENSVQRSEVHTNNAHDHLQPVGSSTAKPYLGPRRPHLQSNLGPERGKTFPVTGRRPSLELSAPRPQLGHQQPVNHSRPKLTQSRSFSNLRAAKQAQSDSKRPLVIDRYSGGLDFGPGFGEISLSHESVVTRRPSSWAVPPKTGG